MFNIQQLFLATAAALMPLLNTDGTPKFPMYVSKHRAARVQRARHKRIKAGKRPF